MSKQIATPVVETLTALTVTYRDAKETYEAHRDRWHAAINDAIEQGMKPADVAAVIKVSPQRVQAIVTRVYAHAAADGAPAAD